MTGLRDDAGRLGPFAGIRVLDFTATPPGQFATMLLGDHGADVVTVEPPSGARDGSSFDEQPYIATGSARRAGDHPLHRSRRSVVVDLKDDRGRELALNLAAQSDVVIESFRPGVMDRLGLGEDAVRQRRPDVVYASISGYGRSGPLSEWSGHELTYGATAGLLSATLPDSEGEVAMPLNVPADIAGGAMTAAFGIAAALLRRARTGEGETVDIAMHRSLRAMVAPIVAEVAAGAPDPSWRGGVQTGAAPFYNCYRSRDGAWIAIAATEPKFFERLCRVLDLEGLARCQHEMDCWPDAIDRIADVVSRRDSEELISRLRSLDVPAAIALGLSEAADEAGNPVAPGERVDLLPSMLAGAEASPHYSDRPGSDSLEVLSDLGLAQDEITRLFDDGVVA